MNEIVIQEGFTARCQKVLQVAKELFVSKPDWVTFFRETLGVNGAARSVFTTQNEYVTFEQSEEYREIQKMVASLRNRKIPGNGGNEPTRVITVRLPESLHEALKAEASDHKTSMNKLCISKLLQVLSENDGVLPAGFMSAMTNGSAMPPVPAPSRSMPPVPKPSNPVPAPATANFRSTFNPPANPHSQNRFGQ